MSKRKRGYGNRNRPILDIPAGDMSIIEFVALPKSRREAIQAGDTGKRCCCPPPLKSRLGGCVPGLTWADQTHTAFKAICRSCLKPLVSGQHRRRDQIHMIGLAKLPLDHVDLEDIAAWGVFVDTSPIDDDSTPIDPGTPFDPGELERALEQYELERAGGLP